MIYQEWELSVHCPLCGADLMPAQMTEHTLFHDTEKPPVADAGGQSVSPGHPPSGVSGASITIGADAVKSMLPPGVFMTADHRYYLNGEGPVPSVTTVLETLSKPALVTWKAKEAVRAYIRNRAILDKILMDQAGGEDAAIAEALKLVDAQRDKAAGIGTGVHLLADIITRDAEATGSPRTGFQVSDEERPYVEGWKSFLAFLEAQGGKIVSSEKAVWSQNGYAGTYDLLVTLPNETLAAKLAAGQVPGEASWLHRGPDELWLLDIKTSKGYYPEYGLQLAGYRWADYIVLPGDPTKYPMPEVHRSGVIHLRPEQYSEGWRLIEYPITYTEDYLTFLGALEIWKWRKANRFSISNLKASEKAKNTPLVPSDSPASTTGTGDKQPVYGTPRQVSDPRAVPANPTYTLIRDLTGPKPIETLISDDYEDEP